MLSIIMTLLQLPKMIIFELRRSSQRTWSGSAEAYDADARDFGVSTPRYSLAAWINWRVNTVCPMRETASLFPEPVCNANQEFVPAIELLEYGFPVSSPSGDEPSGACASSAASAPSHMT